MHTRAHVYIIYLPHRIGYFYYCYHHCIIDDLRVCVSPYVLCVYVNKYITLTRVLLYLPAVGAHNGFARHAYDGRHGACVSGRPFPYAHTAYEKTVHVVTVLSVLVDDSRGGSPDFADARLQPGKNSEPRPLPPLRKGSCGGPRQDVFRVLQPFALQRISSLTPLVVFPLQDKRMSVMDALVHPYIDEGRLRYHSCMCKCCFTVPLTGLRHFCMDYEPIAPQTFDDKWEKKLSNVQQVKGIVFVFTVRSFIVVFSSMFAQKFVNKSNSFYWDKFSVFGHFNNHFTRHAFFLKSRFYKILVIKMKCTILCNCKIL